MCHGGAEADVDGYVEVKLDVDLGVDVYVDVDADVDALSPSSGSAAKNARLYTSSVTLVPRAQVSDKSSDTADKPAIPVDADVDAFSPSSGSTAKHARLYTSSVSVG